MNRPDSAMWTPLMHAAAVGFEDGVIALLRSGADRYHGTHVDDGKLVDAAALALRGPVVHVAVAGVLAADSQVVWSLFASNLACLARAFLFLRSRLRIQRRSPHGAAREGQLAVLEGFAKQGEDMNRRVTARRLFRV